MLEDAASQAVNDVHFEQEEKQRLEIANTRIHDEKIAMQKRIEIEQADIQSYQV